jgi:NAD(P)-dependent dehydrogenase (short-subunit alcohol dehydrogenase family)
MSGETSPSRVAVVTGAGSGIGRAVAVELLGAGWQVVLAGRRADALEGTAAGAPGALAVPTDVTDPGQVDALFGRVGAELGRIDLLVNNAGIFPPGRPTEDVGYHEWMDAVQVNLTGSFLCAQQAFRMMKQQDPRGGRIVNNGSISAHVPRPNSVAYTTTKHAITGLTRSLALDGRAFDIAVGQIDVGNAGTDLMQRVTTGAGALQADGSTRREPVIDVAEVGRAVRFMADLPLNATVPFMTLMATGMPYLGRG